MIPKRRAAAPTASLPLILLLQIGANHGQLLSTSAEAFALPTPVVSGLHHGRSSSLTTTRRDDHKARSTSTSTTSSSKPQSTFRSDQLLVSRGMSHRVSVSSASASSSATTALKLSGGSNDGSSKNELSREMMAEFIGTYLIVQIGCGVVCAATYLGAQVGLWQIAAAWSIAVTLAISTTASVSGAHLNPAISFALALLRPSSAFGWTKFIPYVLSQIAGAAFAGGVNFVLFREACAKFEAAKNIVRGTAGSVASASTFGEYWSVSSWTTAFFAEALGTALLSFVIFALTNQRNETTSKNSLLVPPLIGSTVGALISFIAPLTQAGFNPARDFGPRIAAAFAGWGTGIAFQGWWVYVLAPLVGAPLGGLVADKMLYKEE